MNGFYQMTTIPISVTPVWLQSLDIFQYIVTEKNNLTYARVYIYVCVCVFQVSIK